MESLIISTAGQGFSKPSPRSCDVLFSRSISLLLVLQCEGDGDREGERQGRVMEGGGRVARGEEVLLYFIGLLLILH